jgi:peptidoglycan/LPS O-acetylase OafA/YrhL
LTLTASEPARGQDSRELPSQPVRPRPDEKARGARPPGTQHIKPLDGIRGIAVLLVLLFHFEIGPFRGGYVGVTVFFTLSGFLICSRTLGEIGRTGGFRVVDFFERRVRRLAPAAILCIFGVLIATNLFGAREQHASVGGDAIAALFNVANWRFLLHGTSYTDLFAAPSPLNHFWSLAIEEQFYLAFPVVVWLVLKLPPRFRAMGVALIVSAALEWSAHASSSATNFNRFYYGTDARMAELLVGVIAALSLSYWRISVPRPPGRQRMAVGLLAAAGMATVIGGGMLYRNGASNFQHGGAMFIALGTAALIIGGLEGSNAIARVCSLRPLVWVGKISYGAYLYHWPIVALSGKAWGPLHGTALGLVQLVLSLAIAGVSFRYLEAPIQRRRFAPRRRSLLKGWTQALASVSVVAVALMLFYPAGGSSALAGPGGLNIPAPAKAKKAAVIPKTNAPDRPLRVLVTGDSTGRVMANALIAYQNAHPTSLQVLDLSMVACPITPTDRIRNYSGEEGQNVTLCGGWQKTFAPQVAAFKPDVAVVFLSVMEATDQRTVDGNWDNLLDPSYRQYQLSAYDKFVKVLSSTGAAVEWADAPYFTFRQDLPWVSDDPARIDELNAMYRQLAATHPNVHLLSYAAHLNEPGRYDDPNVRPDGVHMTPQAADRLAQTWLLPQLAPFRPSAKAHSGSG